MSKQKRITVRLTEKNHEFVVATGRGKPQNGFDKLLAFAQMTPRAFEAFLGGRRFSDIGEIITVREGDYLCPACGDVVVRVADACYEVEKCTACNGSGHYDAEGSPPSAACDGTGER